MPSIENKKNINIITVTYNEEKNISKYLLGLKNLEQYFNVTVFVVDQSSEDNTVGLLQKNNHINLFIHPNQGYADPDKKWILENCISDDTQWCFILDPDEEVSLDNAREIYKHINKNVFHILSLKIDSIIWDISIGASYQSRIFVKKYVKLETKVHKYITELSSNVFFLNHPLRNDDKKYEGKAIEILANKMNKYSSLEVSQHSGYSRGRVFFLFMKSLVVSFLYIFFKQKMLFKGPKGIILGFFLLTNQYMTYAKFYEKSITSKE